MKKILSLLVLMMTIVIGAKAAGYSPSADEVIILNDVKTTTSPYSSHAAIAWAGSPSSNSKTAGDPNNGGAATSSNVPCYSTKGNGGAKDITVSITGVSKIIIYHEKHSSRYVELRNTSKTGDIIGKGTANTYYTEVELNGTTDYKIFLHGTAGSDDQDFHVYAVKLIKYVPSTTYTITYKAGAGTGEDVVETAALVGACPEGFTAPTGKSFNGWNTASDGTGTAYAVGDIVNSNLTLFAQWATFYSVLYNLGDATAGTVPTQADVEDGGSFNVAAVPTDLVAPAGKEFKCWNDGTNDVNPGASYTVEGADVTLTAVYQDKTYQGLTPSETLDFANPGTTFASVWYTTEGKLVKNFSYDPTNGKVVMSAYAVYQSVNDQKIAWETFDSGNSSTGEWDATGDFEGSSYYFASEARAASVQAAARIHYYRVTGITGVSALFNGKAAIEAYEVNSGVVFPDPVAKNAISGAGTATITTLDATKEYIIVARGDNGTSNIRFYEIIFTFPAISKETVTIPLEGIATYVTSSALDFSTQNGAFKAYVVTDVNTTFALTAEVTQVPAGTALLLKGAKGSYDVDIIASAEEVTNKLQASNGGVKGDNSTIFAYSKSNAKFMKVAQDVVIPAGKAYLKITTPNANDALDIQFDGETAVEAIAEANEADAAAPVKVVKNGQLFIGNFNVAGQQVK